MRCCLKSVSAAAASIVAAMYCVWVLATSPCCDNSVLLSVLRSESRFDCAWLSCWSAFIVEIITSGLDVSTSRSPAFTVWPATTSIRSTRAVAGAVTCWICSGTSVPGPRISRIMSPRRTESWIDTDRSTVGAAGLSLATAMVVITTASTATPMPMFRPVFFWGGRATSTRYPQGQVAGAKHVWPIRYKASAVPPNA